MILSLAEVHNVLYTLRILPNCTLWLNEHSLLAADHKLTPELEPAMTTVFIACFLIRMAVYPLRQNVLLTLRL
jgi:hypothetical protein